MAVVKSQPYDCSLLGDDDGADVVPCTTRGPTWSIVGNQLVVGALAWMLNILLNIPLERRWRWLRALQPEGSPPPWARRFVGELSHAAEEPFLEQFLELGQFGASSVLIVTFIAKTYQGADLLEAWVFWLEVGCAALCTLHGVFAYARRGFSRAHAFSLLVFLDCFTLPATFLQHAPKMVGGGSWFTLNYLRTFHQLGSLRRLREIGILERFMSDFAAEVSFAAFEMINVVVTISGFMWILEVLGDIPGFQDRFQASGMGDVSFFTMVYFTFVTISTLGYGDYSPSTVPSRFFIVIAIFAGVTFFSYISVSMMNIVEMEASGRGRFRPQKGWSANQPNSEDDERGHILVIGGGVNAGKATVLATFLKALCASRSALGADSPEVVLLSQSARSEGVTKLLKEPWAANLRIHFFLGSPLDKDDMVRVRAAESSTVFIISDTETDDTLAEDQKNIMIAASMTRQFPSLQFRLMVVGLPALRLASQVGLSEYNCFSVEAFKAALVGTSLRCPGFSTLWLNLALPDLPDTTIGYSAGLKKGQQVSPWLQEFTTGSGLEPYGFLPSEEYHGLSFHHVACLIAQKANLLVLAAHVDGAIVVNPSKSCTIDATTVLFALGEDPQSCDCVSKEGTGKVSSWLQQFQLNRTRGSFLARQRGKVVKKQSAAAMRLVHSTGLASSIHGAHSASTQNTASGGGCGGGGDGGGGGGGDSGGRGAHMKSGGMLMLPALGGVYQAGRNKAGGGGDGGGGSGVGGGGGGGGIKHATADEDEEFENLGSMDAAALVEECEENMARCMAVAKAGGHTVVVLTRDSDQFDQETVWAQLEIMVSTAFLLPHTAKSVIVVHERAALGPRRQFLAAHPDGPKGSILASRSTNKQNPTPSGSPKEGSGSPRGWGGLVSFLVGDPMEASVLQAAGAHTCSRLVTLCPSAPTADRLQSVASSELALDEANLVLLMVLEEHLKVWERSWADFHIVFDLYVPRSAALMTPTRNLKVGGGVGVRSNEDDADQKEEVEVFRRRREKRQQQQKAADAKVALADPRAHPRFAAGHVLPKPCISAVYSMAYYTPGVLELLDALANPAKYDQQVAPLSVPVRTQPGLAFTVGKPYAYLAQLFLESGAIPLGLLRAPSEESGASLPYVVTALPKEEGLVVGAGDSVYVLAHVTEWSPSQLEAPPGTPVGKHGPGVRAPSFSTSASSTPPSPEPSFRRPSSWADPDPTSGSIEKPTEALPPLSFPSERSASFTENNTLQGRPESSSRRLTAGVSSVSSSVDAPRSSTSNSPPSTRPAVSSNKVAPLNVDGGFSI